MIVVKLTKKYKSYDIIQEKTIQNIVNASKEICIHLKAREGKLAVW